MTRCIAAVAALLALTASAAHATAPGGNGLIAFYRSPPIGPSGIYVSGIGQHPNDGLDGAPGSQGPSEASGMGRNPGTTSVGHSVGDTFSTFGTR